VEGDVTVRALESSPIEDLESKPKGTRFFVVSVLDPETSMVIKGSIALDPNDQDHFRGECEKEGKPFEEVLPWVAVYRVLDRVWDGPPPEGHQVRNIEEVSREELLKRIRANIARTSSMAG
jgi:hypothetical protein